MVDALCVQLGMCVWMFEHKKCVQKEMYPASGSNPEIQAQLERVVTLTALTQLLRGLPYSGAESSSSGPLLGLRGQNTLSRVILQNGPKALLLWKESCHSSDCNITDFQSSCCFLAILDLSKHSLIKFSDLAKKYKTQTECSSKGDLFFFFHYRCEKILKMDSFYWKCDFSFHFTHFLNSLF